MDYIERRTEKEYAYPVTIGEDCWIGGGAILLRRQIEESGKVGTPLFVTRINANAAGFEYLYRLETAGR